MKKKIVSLIFESKHCFYAAGTVWRTLHRWNIKIKILCQRARVLFDILNFWIFENIQIWNCCRSYDYIQNQKSSSCLLTSDQFFFQKNSFKIVKSFTLSNKITSNTKPLWFKWFLTESIIPTLNFVEHNEKNNG